MKKILLTAPGKIHPAVIAVWAAVVAAAHLIPTIPMLFTGGTFSLATVLAPLSGIFFGPIAGAICSAAGGFIGSLIAPHTALLIGPFTFIIGTVSAFTAGCIAWGGRHLISLNMKGGITVNGGIIVYLTGTVLWFTQETGRGLILFPVIYYGVGFAALIIGSIFAAGILAGNNIKLKLPALWICAFGGMIGGATVASFFSLVLLEIPKEVWAYLTIAAPVERAVFSLGTVLVGAPLLAGLPKIGVFVGPAAEPETMNNDQS